MNHKTVALAAGLHIVATPIGAARDITLRALDILASADILVAEDTRSLKKLLTLHGIPLGRRPVWSYHDHSSDKVRDRIVDELRAGRSVAYASEAGTPLISDPGHDLVHAVAKDGGSITTAPGPSAVLSALTLAGLPTDRFVFLGFLPPKPGPRVRLLKCFAPLPATLVIYESPKRIHNTLGELCDSLGEDREAALCREMTKRFEEVIRAPLGALRDMLAHRELKGECVLAVGPPTRQDQDIDMRDVDRALDDALARGSLRDAATEIAEVYGMPRKDVYAMALARGAAQRDGEED